MNCFHRAVYLITGNDPSAMPAAPTFESKDNVVGWDGETILPWRPWLEANGLTMTWDDEWQTGKPCIVSFMVWNDEFPWAHSVVAGRNGRLAMCDEHFGGYDIEDLFDMQSRGTLSLAPFIRIEQRETSND